MVALAFVPPIPFHSWNGSSTFDFHKNHVYIKIAPYSKNIIVSAS